MYKPVQPIRCPKCGTTVNINTSMILTSNPPCYEWICPNCGEKGYTKQGDFIALENQAFIEATTPPKTRSCNIPAPQFIQQGWECPKCGAILAPYQSFCPFCSKKESDWVTTVGTGTQPLPFVQYTNPNPSTAISLGDKPKTPVSDNIIFTTHCDNIKATL